MEVEGESLPVEWYGDALSYKSTFLPSNTYNVQSIINSHKKLHKKQKIQHIKSLKTDWVYIVSPFDTWAEMFSD